MNWHNKQSQKQDGITQGIWLNNTTLARLFACFLIYSFLVFMVGYFWGKYALSYDVLQEAEGIASKDSALIAEYAAQGQSALHEPALQPMALPMPLDTAPQLAGQGDDASQNPEKIVPQFYAPLAGFPKESAAHTFAQKLKDNGIDVEVKKRSSKSAKGNQVTWYQVATMPFTNREELVKLVERIRRQEHLTDDVRVLVC